MTNKQNGRVQQGQKASKEAYRGDSANPIAVERYLKGVDYPADKSELKKCAQKNAAPEDILDIINQLPDQKYNTPVDISKSLSQKK